MMVKQGEKNSIIIIGPTPPPYHGVAGMTEFVLKSKPLKSKFKLVSLNTSDRRDLRNIGKFDLINCYLGLKHFIEFLSLLAVKGIDVVYLPVSQNSLAYLRDGMFILIAKLFKKKVVVHLHGGYFRQFYGQTNTVMKLFIKNSIMQVDCAIVLGECLRDQFRLFLPDEKIEVVPNGIDATDIEKAFEKRKKDGKIKRILYLGQLSKEKGVLDILSAIPEVVIKNKDVKFVFAGSWKKDGVKAEEIIKKSGISEFVEFIDVVVGGSKARLLVDSDMFVIPTYYPLEGHPLVILEAMAAGLPVISTDRAAIKETITDGVNGFIVKENNPGEIAEKINILLEDKKLGEDMGGNNIKKFHKEYTLELFEKNMNAVFDKIQKGGDE